MPNPIQPLRDAVKARLQALGGWSGLEDTHIMLGLDMVDAYVAGLESQVAKLDATFVICDFCLEALPLSYPMGGAPGNMPFTSPRHLKEQLVKRTRSQRAYTEKRKELVDARQANPLSPRLRGGI
mgnify:CR=1 FL=1